MEILENALIGGFAGAAYGAEGFFFNKKDKKEEFDWGKFLPDVLLSGLAGVFVGMQTQNMPTEASLKVGITAVSSLGIGKLLKKGIKILFG